MLGKITDGKLKSIKDTLNEIKEPAKKEKVALGKAKIINKKKKGAKK